MKKYILVLFLAVGGVFLNHFLLGFATTDDLLRFVQSQPLNHWTAMARVSAGDVPVNAKDLCQVVGTEAIDYTGPILGLTSAGIDPRICGIDLVLALKSKINNNQIGSPALLNDDVFAVLALISAGEPVSSVSVQAGVQTLLANQQTNGSFGFTPGGKDDADMTASAVWALSSAGEVGAVQKARAFLQTKQNPDGGFPMYGSVSSNPFTTSWVLLAGVGGDRARQYLNSLGSSTEAGSYRLLALSGKTVPLRIISAPNQTISNPALYFKIIGKTNQECSGQTDGNTALEVMKNGAISCGFSFDISGGSDNSYVRRIGSDTAEGLFGWMFTVNDSLAAMSAGLVLVKPQDKVLWFYGEVGQTPPMFGNLSASQTVSVETQARVGLAVVVNDHQGGGVTSSVSEARLEVDSAQLHFGNLKPGDNTMSPLLVSNKGNTRLQIGATVRGADIFVQNTTIDTMYWAQYSAVLPISNSKQLNVGLTIPVTAQSGSYAGEMTIWGRKAN